MPRCLTWFTRKLQKRVAEHKWHLIISWVLLLSLSGACHRWKSALRSGVKRGGKNFLINWFLDLAYNTAENSKNNSANTREVDRCVGQSMPALSIGCIHRYWVKIIISSSFCLCKPACWLLISSLLAPLVSLRLKKLLLMDLNYFIYFPMSSRP